MALSGDHRPVLVTGATGYIGGRLVPRLLAAGHRVRVLARDPRKLESRPWSRNPRAQLVAGDAGDAAAIRGACEGCRAAYYLIHSMIVAGKSYRDEDRRLASVFARAAAEAGLERIIYLGGLGETGAGLSDHLASRREVETELAAGPVPVTVLRAAMIIGAGSASFETLRYLVERLPVMITPRWVSTECQPIAVRNALEYLVASLDAQGVEGRTLDIGGPDVASYRDILQIMAAALDLRPRLILPVPVLTPRLSSLWIHIVTPIDRRIARPLAEGLRNRVVCRDDEAVRLMPQRLLGLREAVEEALGRHLLGQVETAWSDAGVLPGDPDWAGGASYSDRRQVSVAAAPEDCFRALSGLGGGRGWDSPGWLWRLRGAMDRVIGGPGLLRGRRDPKRLAYGDALDFWRVTAVEEGRRLRLRAEMRLPGEAELEFEISPLEGGGCELAQTARFRPRGLAGLLYWYAVMPFHALVFGSMIRGLKARAESLRAV